MPLIEDFIEAVEVATQGVLPEGFFDTYDYVQAENDKNFCHPRTLGFLAKAAWSLPATRAVEIDRRFNLGNSVKFQPDLVVRDQEEKVAMIVDFESPNSSDERIVTKDVGNYMKWITACSPPKPVEYLIITALPDKSSPRWKALYDPKERKTDIRQNPFRYWYQFYREKLDRRWRDFPIRFANFNGNKLSDSTRFARSG
ncbi:MAG: hypothetical protein ACREQI_08330 [Candidatus Binataceae bacterium]